MLIIGSNLSDICYKSQLFIITGAFQGSDDSGDLTFCVLYLLWTQVFGTTFYPTETM